jgi:ligand-binding SRPBCC domain-containing protein
MPVITLETEIEAPIERVFDLARSIELHKDSMEHTRERPVAGVTSGLIGFGETVTWEAVHFGIRQRLTSRITVCDRPTHLQDVMAEGIFAGFVHDHFLSPAETGTLMKDVFDYTSPLGHLGTLADVLFLERYMTGLLLSRNAAIKAVAEGKDWKKYVG